MPTRSGVSREETSGVDPATQTHDDSPPDSDSGPDDASRPDEQIESMKRLLERAEHFSATVQSEIEELDSLRREALATVRSEAEEIRQEAHEEAEAVLARAEETARKAVEEARAEASDITARAGEELSGLQDVAGRYGEALQGALALILELPRLDSPRDASSGDLDGAAPATGSTNGPPEDPDGTVRAPGSTNGARDDASVVPANE